jgi:hypothetical protein
MAPRRGGKHPPPSHERGGFAAPLAYQRLASLTGRTEAQDARAEGCLLRPSTPAGARPFQADYGGLERRAPLLARMAPGRSLRGNGPVEPTGAEGLDPRPTVFEAEPKPYNRAGSGGLRDILRDSRNRLPPFRFISRRTDLSATIPRRTSSRRGRWQRC